MIALLSDPAALLGWAKVGMGLLGTMLLAALARALPKLLPLLMQFLKSAYAHGLLQLVSKAGLIAASAAAAAMRDALEKAKAPDSPGGGTITDDEKRSIMSAGVRAGMASLRASGVMGKILELYGYAAPPGGTVMVGNDPALPVMGEPAGSFFKAHDLVEASVREKALSQLAASPSKDLRGLAAAALVALLCLFGAAPAQAQVTGWKQTTMTGTGAFVQVASSLAGQRGCGVQVTATDTNVSYVGVSGGSTSSATSICNAAAPNGTCDAVPSYFLPMGPQLVYVQSPVGIVVKVTTFTDCGAQLLNRMMSPAWGGSGGGVSGSGANTRVAYWTAANTLAGDANFTWAPGPKQLTVAGALNVGTAFQVSTAGIASYSTNTNTGVVAETWTNNSNGSATNIFLRVVNDVGTFLSFGIYGSGFVTAANAYDKPNHGLVFSLDALDLVAYTGRGIILWVNNTIQAMTIASSGNVSIGTATDDGVNKLQVTGASKFTGNSTVTGQLAVGPTATLTNLGNFQQDQNAITSVSLTNNNLGAAAQAFYSTLQNTGSGSMSMKLGNISGAYGQGATQFNAISGTGGKLVVGTTDTNGVWLASNGVIRAGVGLNGLTGFFVSTGEVPYATDRPAQALAVKSTAGFTGSANGTDTATVRTTDATVTTIYTFQPVNGSLGWAEAKCIGRDEAGVDRAFVITQAAIRQQGGVTTLETTATPVNFKSNAAWSVAWSGALLRVTGAAATNVSWACTVSQQSVSTSL